MMKYNISYKNCKEMLIDFFFNVSSRKFTNGDTKYMSHLLYRFRGKLESSTGASIIYELLHSQHYEKLNEQVLW